MYKFLPFQICWDIPGPWDIFFISLDLTRYHKIWKDIPWITLNVISLGCHFHGYPWLVPCPNILILLNRFQLQFVLQRNKIQLESSLESARFSLNYVHEHHDWHDTVHQVKEALFVLGCAVLLSGFLQAARPAFKPKNSKETTTFSLENPCFQFFSQWLAESAIFVLQYTFSKYES